MRRRSLLLALAATACAPPAELAVDLHTDLEAGRDFREVRTWLGQAPEPRAVAVEDADAFAVGARVATYADLGPGDEVISVRLVGEDGETVAIGERRLALGDGPQATTVRALTAPRILTAWDVTALRLGARLFAWGRLDHLEPDRATDARVGPFEVGRDVRDVCSSSIETCVLHRDGELACVRWGGDVPSRRVVSDHSGHGHRALTCAGYLSPHRCMLDDDGGVTCSGADQAGQLGDGPTDSSGALDDDVAVPGLEEVIALAPGSVHTCALDRAGRLSCWGSNNAGQIGNGEGGDGLFVDAPFEVPLADVVAADAWYQTACAIVRGGELWCWGSNADGQVRDGGDPIEPSPVRASRVERVARVAVGAGHLCVVRLDDPDAVHCWGRNADGQLGDGTTEARAEPVRVGLGGRVLALDAHAAHTCALVTDGGALELLCWGQNDDGEIGAPEPARLLRPAPVALPGLHSQ